MVKNQKVGGLGDIGCLVFILPKILDAGDGGIVVRIIKIIIKIILLRNRRV